MSKVGLETPHQVVASAIVDKYIGESARIIREMFGYAKEHQPCIIFMDEPPRSMKNYAVKAAFSNLYTPSF